MNLKTVILVDLVYPVRNPVQGERDSGMMPNAIPG